MPTFAEDALDSLIDALRAAQAAAEAEARAAASPGVNDVAGITLYAVSSMAGGPPLTIVYQDSDGVTSVRHITVNSIERCLSGAVILRVYDHDRHAPRTFRLDRIMAAAAELRQLGTITWA